MIAILEENNFQKFTNLRSGFTTRKGGVSKGLFAESNFGYNNGDDNNNVDQNFKLLAQKIQILPENILILKQIHSDKVHIVQDIYNDQNAPEADALVTNIPNIALAIKTADCTPVLFADHINKVIGAAHCGWKGAFAGLAHNTINEMIKLGAELKNISVCIGPTIHQKNYEVDDSFYKKFIEQHIHNKKFFIDSVNKNHYMFNLPAYIHEQLQNISIKNIFNINKDTYSDAENFFSYRRRTHNKESGGYGLQLSYIIL